MKKIKIIIIILSFVTLGTRFSWGATEPLDLTQINFDLVKDPFEPQLPLETIQPITPPEVEIEEPGAGEVTEAEEPEPLPVVEEEPPEEIVLPEINIRGLVWNSNRPQAIVNDRVVDVGDTVEEIKIVAIDKTGIEVDYQGVAFIVRP